MLWIENIKWKTCNIFSLHHFTASHQHLSRWKRWLSGLFRVFPEISLNFFILFHPHWGVSGDGKQGRGTRFTPVPETHKGCACISIIHVLTCPSRSGHILTHEQSSDPTPYWAYKVCKRLLLNWSKCECFHHQPWNFALKKSLDLRAQITGEIVSCWWIVQLQNNLTNST